MEFKCDSAKQFLLSRLSEQASQEGVALDEIERRMFLFSESSGRPDLEANEKFEKDYDSTAYESKVTKLLGRVYANDKKNEADGASWKAALKTLAREDFYGLVMIDQARIPRTNDLAIAPGSIDSWRFLIGMLPLALVEIGVLVVGCILVFQPFRFGLHLPDWFRLLLMPLFFWLFWYSGRRSEEHTSEL